MHSNIWATFYLFSIPAGLSLLVGLLQWIIKRRLPRKTLILALILAVIPIAFIMGHIRSEKKEMIKRQGVYKVIKSNNMQELCSTVNVEGLQLTLLKSGIYSFNIKPCFADKSEGKWKWQDDLVGTYAVFDIKINKHAYFHFDDKDSLHLIRDGRKFLSFAKQ